MAAYIEDERQRKGRQKRSEACPQGIFAGQRLELPTHLNGVLGCVCLIGHAYDGDEGWARPRRVEAWAQKRG